ncbi:MAG: cadmium-translocating P-type ATPase [Sphingobacteriales bacterium JAD_PAG50586_3]|nr:MAG: cadmium-translocating P-type ATPase [Sphingobacteriales bacterium JAD_PAG50586_3]
MEHQHIYDAQGRQLCCTLEDKINVKAQKHIHKDHSDEEGHDHEHIEDESKLKLFLSPAISFAILALGLAFDYLIHPSFFKDWVRIVWFGAAYLPVGLPVIKEAIQAMGKGEIFTEFLLMGIATIGAFAIGEYPEGVAVMLFYAIGEAFQTLAVARAKNNIKNLIDQRPDEVTIVENGNEVRKKAATVAIGETFQLRPGEKVAVDGELISDSASFNTAALTGESKPDTLTKGQPVLAGMINMNTVALVKVTTVYADSKLSKILELVQNASSQKAPTELFIRKFAKYYTPAVVVLAVAICFVPYFFVSPYVFNDWLYRALIFLVISCPCALVISIPLGYFGGIGAASRNGILIKGGNYLDVMASIKNVVMDKTGTLTKGVFDVQEVKLKPGFDEKEVLALVNTIESKSTHPIAVAVSKFIGKSENLEVQNIEEISGHGMKALIKGKEVLVGNFKLLSKFNIAYDDKTDELIYTTIAIAIDGKYAGYITIADELKEDAKQAIENLHKMGIKTTMLSGDKANIVEHIAKELNIDNAYGSLLPEDKVTKVKDIKAKGGTVAFVGDGVNDAPVIAISDAGIAMGGLGSDAAIETADIVIQKDNPLKIATAILIGKKTKQVVWQNIGFAFGVKAIVLVLGAGGLATMWEAVFADVGVALLAILNAMRIQKMKF